MIKVVNNLVFARNLPLGLNCQSPLIEGDKATCIEALIAQQIQNPFLPTDPPFEIHPYTYQLHDYEKYIVGTFPPISYLLDNASVVEANISSLRQPPGVGGRIIKKPEIPFFHGNRGSMWDYILTQPEYQNLFGNQRHNRRQWLINKLYETGINYGDIITSVQRNLNREGRYDAKDINLNNICINNDLITHILKNPKAKSILFNTGSIFGESGLRVVNGSVDVSNDAKSFDLFVHGCQNLGMSIDIQIQSGPLHSRFEWKTLRELSIAQKRRKIAFEMRLTNLTMNPMCGLAPRESKTLSVFTGPSPSTISELGLNGNAICNFWLGLNNNSSRKDFIRFVYQGFRNNNYQLIYELNQA